MLFYFCETCGKRITDQQILDGLGSDKKLKGIYCKSCAVGVNTMEFDAISEDELKKPVRKSGPNPVPIPKSGGHAIPRKDPQRSTPPTGVHAQHAKTHPSKSVIHPARPNQSALKIVAAAAGSLLLLTLIVFATRAQAKKTALVDSHPTVPASDANSPAVPLPGPPAPPTPPIPPTPPALPTLPALPTPAPDTQKEITAPPPVPLPSTPPETAVATETKGGADQQALAKSDYDKLVKQVGALDKGDSAGRLALVDAFLKEHGDSTMAESARTLRDGIVAVDQYKKTHAVLDDVPDLKPQATDPASKVAETKTTDPKVEAELATQKMVQDAYTLLAQANLSGAVKSVEQHGNAPAATRGLLKSGLESLQKRDALWHEGLAKTVGRKVKLETKSGVVEGTILAADSDALKIDKTLVLDGAVRGSATVAVNFADILPASRELVALPAPATQEEWVGQTFTCVLRHDPVAAEAALAHCEDSALQAALKILATAEVTAAREAQAQAQWKKAEDLFTASKWKAARQAYEALQHDFTGTYVLTANSEALAKRLEKIDEMLLATQAVSLDLGGGLKLDLMPIPAGEFEMGSNDGDANEKPVHKVKITRPFLMGKYLVTQAQYEKVMGKNPCKSVGENFPVDRVNYSDATEFCKKLSKLSGKMVRLPTEAEWEYACRAGTKTKYYFGDSDTLLEQAAWFAKNSAEKATAVGLKKPNPWGLYDMYGSVYQICQDSYVADFYSKSPPEDPECTTGSECVLRGGNRTANARECRSASRGGIWKGDSSYYKPFGFRVVVSSATKTH